MSQKSSEAGLAKGALSTMESIVMGIAGTAPAFSVAVTTATIVAAVGDLSVGAIFYCGLIMFGLMLAFKNLNKMSPHAGATYAWVGAVFGPAPQTCLEISVRTQERLTRCGARSG